jgi:hypothetical protein
MTDFERLSEIMKESPDLVFFNHGYENLPQEVVAANKAAISEIETILKTCVKGFVSFQNFKPRKDGSTYVRYQVRYNDEGSFTGVAYTPLELFKTEEEITT